MSPQRRNAGHLLRSKAARSSALLLALAAGVLTLAGADPEGEGARPALDRLRSMPLERRQALARSLQTFNGLDRDEQQRLRDIDRQLAELDPATRARFERVLRRYDLWFRSLTPEQQARLKAVPPGDRLAVVRQVRGEQAQGPTTGVPADWLQVSALTPSFLEPTAYQTKVWLALDAAERAEVLKERDPLARARHMAALGTRKGVRREFRQEHQAFQQRVEQAKQRLENLPALKQRLEQTKARQKRQDGPEQVIGRLRDALFLREFRPEPTRIENLRRFEDGMPPWLRETLDPLPPEAARQRLLLLYRLVFPAPEEMPAPPPSPATAPGRKPPPPGGPGTPAPF